LTAWPKSPAATPTKSSPRIATRRSFCLETFLVVPAPCGDDDSCRWTLRGMRASRAAVSH
jgi:hypothetical protein